MCAVPRYVPGAFVRIRKDLAEMRNWLHNYPPVDPSATD
jgi:hypothetical protein